MPLLLWTYPGTHSVAPLHHHVEFVSQDGLQRFGTLTFQDGPVSEYGENGTTNEDVLGAIIERLNALNAPPYNCRENSLAITHLQEALHWLEHRARATGARAV
jgi:hypothetical protein